MPYLRSHGAGVTSVREVDLSEERNPLVAAFRDAARSDRLAVLEGLHALKHGLRFGAELRAVVSPSPEGLLRLAQELAPDLVPVLARLVQQVPADLFRDLSVRPPASPVLAIARRREVDVAALLRRDEFPVVLLHDPRHAGNAGAVVRVAAAAGAAGVLVTGGLDPWSAPVVRAAAGLQYAVDVGTCAWPPATDRPLVALDPDGQEFRPDLLPSGAMLVFGGERHGLPDETLDRADLLLRLPMREHVSSLNLATSVSAVLYSWRMAAPARAWPLEVVSDDA